jgi:excisionase family DNA binding protein
VNDLTRKLKVGPRAIRRLITRGRLRGVKVRVGYRVTERSLTEFLEGGKADGKD